MTREEAIKELERISEDTVQRDCSTCGRTTAGTYNGVCCYCSLCEVIPEIFKDYHENKHFRSHWKWNRKWKNEALDMAISALRQQELLSNSKIVKSSDMYDEDGGEILNGETVIDSHQMTNADRINAMTIEEKAEFLSRIAYAGETPWSVPFLEKFCNNCPTVHGTYESGVEDDFHECDFTDGKCPHGTDIVWWLQQPAEEEKL